jgi:hypothetical protein
MSETRIESICRNYGLLRFEAHLLLALNDRWKFTFNEFAIILAQTPKSYNDKFFISEQRYLDSVEWLKFIGTFRSSDFGFEKFQKLIRTCIERHQEIALKEKVKEMKGEVDLNQDKYDLVREKYGLLDYELSMFIDLNDNWKFTFDEFILILENVPKSYGPDFEKAKQRYIDSIKWLEFIQTFRPKESVMFTFDGAPVGLA